MGSRLELHEELIKILGSKNVYFQPPESIKIKYPAIIYNKKPFYKSYADNNIYSRLEHYQVTIIDPNPDTVIPLGMENNMKYCNLDNIFSTNGLNHYIYSLFY